MQTLNYVVKQSTKKLVFFAEAIQYLEETPHLQCDVQQVHRT